MKIALFTSVAILVSLILLSAAQAATKNICEEALASAPWELIQEGPKLTLKQGSANILRGMSLLFRFGPEAVRGKLHPESTGEGSNRAGEYKVFRYRFESEKPHRVEAAVLEFQFYPATNTWIAFLDDYRGEAPDPVEGIQITMDLAEFARGLSLEQHRVSWLVPAFTRDPLQIPTSTSLLWNRGRQNEQYHFMLPLVDNGFTGKLGDKLEPYHFHKRVFRVASGSGAPGHMPDRVGLFAYSTNTDPYKLPEQTLAAAFAATDATAKLRQDKPFPAAMDGLSLDTWNGLGKYLTEDSVIAAVDDLLAKGLRMRYLILDDLWNSIDDRNRLVSFEADPVRFPHGIAWLAKELKNRGVELIVWHTDEGYWNGVSPDSELAQYPLFEGNHEIFIPDPRRSEFYEAFYRFLAESGVAGVKPDDAGFYGVTEGRLPNAEAIGGQQRNLQNAAAQNFPSNAILHCMGMTLPCLFNAGVSNVSRMGEDITLPANTNPEMFPNPQTPQDHVLHYAYNGFVWSAVYYPDWDMTHTMIELPDDGPYDEPRYIEKVYPQFHMIGRVISGGILNFADRLGHTDVPLLNAAVFDDGRLMRLDAPGQVVKEQLLKQPDGEALRMFGHLTQADFKTGVVAVFNTDKVQGTSVPGQLKITDAGDLASLSREGKVAVYQRGTNEAFLLDQKNPSYSFELGFMQSDLFTLAPVNKGVGIFGLLNKYLGARAVTSVSFKNKEVLVELREGGEFGAYLASAPQDVVELGQDGQWHSTEFAYDETNKLLRVSVSGSKFKILR